MAFQMMRIVTNLAEYPTIAPGLCGMFIIIEKQIEEVAILRSYCENMKS